MSVLRRLFLPVSVVALVPAFLQAPTILSIRQANAGKDFVSSSPLLASKPEKSYPQDPPKTIPSLVGVANIESVGRAKVILGPFVGEDAAGGTSNASDISLDAAASLHAVINLKTSPSSGSGISENLPLQGQRAAASASQATSSLKPPLSIAVQSGLQSNFGTTTRAADLAFTVSEKHGHWPAVGVPQSLRQTALAAAISMTNASRMLQYLSGVKVVFPEGLPNASRILPSFLQQPPTTQQIQSAVVPLAKQSAFLQGAPVQDQHSLLVSPGADADSNAGKALAPLGPLWRFIGETGVALKQLPMDENQALYVALFAFFPFVLVALTAALLLVFDKWYYADETSSDHPLHRRFYQRRAVPAANAPAIPARTPWDIAQELGREDEPKLWHASKAA